MSPPLSSFLRAKKSALLVGAGLIASFFITLVYLQQSSFKTAFAPSDSTSQNVPELQVRQDRLTPVDSFYYRKSYNDSFTNSTLNFGQLVYINVPGRYDRDDGMILQSEISGLKPMRFIGVEANKLNDKGLSPLMRPNPMVPGVVACIRSHADVWQRFLLGGFNAVDYSGQKDTTGFHQDLSDHFTANSDLKSIFVMEADAAWDINVRRNMFNFGRGVEQFLNSRGILQPGEHATEQDPYLSEHWDVMQFNGCYINQKPTETFQMFDPDSPANTGRADPNFEKTDRSKNSPNRGYFEMGGKAVLPGHRMIRFRSEEACTAGYAISRRGARKLLSRVDANMDGPVDLIIADMVAKKELDTYSAYPVIISQWSYDGSLGINWKNSDVNRKEHNYESEEDAITADELPALKAKWGANKKNWMRVHARKNIWSVDSVQIKDAAFGHIQGKVFGN